MGVNHRVPSWMLAIVVHPLDLNNSHPFHVQNTLILSQGRPKSHSTIASKSRKLSSTSGVGSDEARHV